MSVRIIPISAPADVPVSEPELVLDLVSPSKTVCDGSRVVLGGKFLWAGQEKLFVRGVTYGTFRPGIEGSAFPSPRVVHSPATLASGHCPSMQPARHGWAARGTPLYVSA